MSARILVMGDVHGNLHAFEQCMDRCNFDLKNDVLIQLGDVSDRYPDTAMVVQRLIGIPNLIAIRGNHDEWTMQWVQSGIIVDGWINNGGIATLTSYEMSAHEIEMSAHEKFWTEKQKDFHIDDKNRIFVHGGFTDSRGPSYDSGVEICRWDRMLWNAALSGSKSLSTPNLLKGFKEIYIGHTPTLNWGRTTPMNACNVWNLDTGAGTVGKLTIMDVDTKEYWQSDFVDQLY